VQRPHHIALTTVLWIDTAYHPLGAAVRGLPVRASFEKHSVIGARQPDGDGLALGA
jgi:hypothetical protein